MGRWAKTLTAEFVPMRHVCYIREPQSLLRCTRRPDHNDDHKNFYAGVTNSSGIRPGVSWPRRKGESQAD
ncbi:hypothetical protein [Streptomyces sp. NPDC049813]|uniref:hypothetical protein n=1 Tax=Streptomyces sp. NPDC049813 TaxID=3365597 RepID=UPI0037B17E7A